ncbi:hypothetical protein [Roseomonas sp. 18066]|uniref:hypothetical protein n=1 Tax=Roseomonas sp. 18066 TaxID=2681412 RepID=UPI0013583D58|nr:hypothetical protein [Roseomonas sp. 18066]
MVFIVKSGCVRGDDFLVDVTGPIQDLQRLILRFEAGQTRFDLHVDLAEPPATLRITTGVNGDAGDGSLHLALPIEQVPQAFTKLSVLVPSGEKYRKIPSEPGSFFLKNLYAETAEEFASHFYRNRHRVKDKETLAFAAEQILRHYTLDPAHRAVCLVIFCYRAIDFASRPMAERALRYAETIEAELPKLPVDGNVRSDRHHLTMSVNLALWHLHLFMEDGTALLRRLQSGYKYMTSVEEPWAVMAFNSCRTCLLLGYFLERMGDPGKARGLFRKNLDFYKKAMQRAERFSTHFLEMVQAHHAVYLSLLSVEKIRDGEGQIDLDTLFDAVSRTKDGEVGDSMKQKLGRLLDAAHAPRPSLAGAEG